MLFLFAAVTAVGISPLFFLVKFPFPRDQTFFARALTAIFEKV